jgi:UDPglucose 6-dehydrogenase
MKICVVGTGYVGLVVAAGFAEMGHDVVGHDVDDAKIAMLQRGQVPIYEPGLGALINRNSAEGRLHFTANLGEAVTGAQVVALAVGTPPGPDGSADLSFIFGAAEAVSEHLEPGAVVVTKSTVPVGTGDLIESLIRKTCRHDFSVASNPEFLKEGAAVADFMKPDRIIIGASDPRAISILRDVYEPFTRSTDGILVMDRRSAEVTKYAANGMLATRISFMNDLANLCDALGADIEAVRKGIGTDVRIGPKFLYAGVGFGGSCFPKDLRALVNSGKQAGTPLELVEAVIAVNERQKRILGERILTAFGPNPAGKRVAIWGLSFKPDTDDIREAPALVLIEQLLAAGVAVTATDPEAIPATQKVFGDRVRFESDNYRCAEGADALALVTEWRQYRRPNFERLRAAMRSPIVFDGRNQWDPAALRSAGFSYHGVGRGLPARATRS